MTRHTVVVAGATGFVGQALVEALVDDFEVIGLSRGATTMPRATMRKVDLLDAEATEAALAGARLAVFLVHSMMPSERLVQGAFSDIDLIVADNFARAAARNGVEHIVFLGGLVPPGGPQSSHIASRVEVEVALAAYGVPVTTLRAGLVFGPGGSSSRIVFNLARRLPVMVCPRWTEVDTQPIALDDVVGLIRYVLFHPETRGETFDIGGPDVVTYRRMMEQVGEVIVGRKAWSVGVPVLTPGLSRLWVSMVTGAPKELVEPLIGSLSHPMVARDRRLQERAGIPGRPMAEVLPEAVAGDRDAGKPLAFQSRKPSGEPLVRSVQRMSGHGMKAIEVADAYFAWLGSVLPAIFYARRGDDIELGINGWPRPLLVLRPLMRSDDRVVYHIVAGALVAQPETTTATFEFREVLAGKAVLVSIAGYRPSLPWWLYVVTQAQGHRAVMALFSRYLDNRDIAKAPHQGASSLFKRMRVWLRTSSAESARAYAATQ